MPASVNDRLMLLGGFSPNGQGRGRRPNVARPGGSYQIIDGPPDGWVIPAAEGSLDVTFYYKSSEYGGDEDKKYWVGDLVVSNTREDRDVQLRDTTPVQTWIYAEEEEEIPDLSNRGALVEFFISLGGIPESSYPVTLTGASARVVGNLPFEMTDIGLMVNGVYTDQINFADRYNGIVYVSGLMEFTELLDTVSIVIDYTFEDATGVRRKISVGIKWVACLKRATYEAISPYIMDTGQLLDLGVAQASSFGVPLCSLVVTSSSSGAVTKAPPHSHWEVYNEYGSGWGDAYFIAAQTFPTALTGEHKDKRIYIPDYCAKTVGAVIVEGHSEAHAVVPGDPPVSFDMVADIKLDILSDVPEADKDEVIEIVVRELPPEKDEDDEVLEVAEVVLSFPSATQHYSIILNGSESSWDARRGSGQFVEGGLVFQYASLGAVLTKRKMYGQDPKNPDWVPDGLPGTPGMWIESQDMWVPVDDATWAALQSITAPDSSDPNTRNIDTVNLSDFLATPEGLALREQSMNATFEMQPKGVNWDAIQMDANISFNPMYDQLTVRHVPTTAENIKNGAKLALNIFTTIGALISGASLGAGLINFGAAAVGGGNVALGALNIGMRLYKASSAVGEASDALWSYPQRETIYTMNDPVSRAAFLRDYPQYAPNSNPAQPEAGTKIP